MSCCWYCCSMAMRILYCDAGVAVQDADGHAAEDGLLVLRRGHQGRHHRRHRHGGRHQDEVNAQMNSRSSRVATAVNAFMARGGKRRAGKSSSKLGRVKSVYFTSFRAYAIDVLS